MEKREQEFYKLQKQVVKLTKALENIRRHLTLHNPNNDIHAIINDALMVEPEYEWQWLKCKDGYCDTTRHFKSKEDYCNFYGFTNLDYFDSFVKLEASKREVKKC